MTQQELDAIPEAGGIGYRQEIIDGRRVNVPYMIGGGALWDRRVVLDSAGQRWGVGTLSGQLVKQRMPR